MYQALLYNLLFMQGIRSLGMISSSLDHLLGDGFEEKLVFLAV